MNHKHNKIFGVILVLVTFFFIGLQSVRILSIEIPYLDVHFQSSTAFVYLILLLYIPLAFFITFFVPATIVIKWNITFPTIQPITLPTIEIVVPSSLRKTKQRTIAYQVFRC